MRYHDLVDGISDLVKIPAQVANGATAYVGAWYAPYKCRVTSFGYVPIEGVTGTDTDSRNLNVKTSAGVEKANLDLEAGTDLTAKTFNEIPITATGGYVDLEEGAVMLFESELVGTNGLAVGLGDWVIIYKGN